MSKLPKWITDRLDQAEADLARVEQREGAVDLSDVSDDELRAWQVEEILRKPLEDRTAYDRFILAEYGPGGANAT